jgi:hypothetical protein
MTSKTPKRGVGSVVKEQLIAGATNEAALATAKAEFPDSSTTTATVSWHRNSLRKNGNPLNVPTASEARGKSAPEPVEEFDPLA